MTQRSEFLDRVRAGLGRTSSHSVAAPPGDSELLRLAHEACDLASLFAARAGPMGINVHRCALTDAATTLRSLVDPICPTAVVVDELEPAIGHQVERAISGLAAHLVRPRVERSLDPQFDAEIGITGVLAGIAETGTLVVASDATRSRGTFIIPPIHIAIMRESQIIADLIDLWPRLGPALPTALTLISGPSKTADIEGILVTGVHGPGTVHVLLVSDEPTAAAPRGPHSQGERS